MGEASGEKGEGEKEKGGRNSGGKSEEENNIKAQLTLESEDDARIPAA